MNIVSKLDLFIFDELYVQEGKYEKAEDKSRDN